MPFPPLLRLGCRAVFAAALSFSSLSAQGEFVNFEPPAVKPATVVRLAGHDYLVVCNTPDDTVEIYDTTDNSFVTSFKTGRAPVTARFAASRAEIYTTNYIGDSVTIARLIPPTGNQPLRAEVRRTAQVGDEPTDLIFFPDDRAILVTLGSRSAVAWYDAEQMFPIGGPLGQRILLTFPLADVTAPKAIKEPRRLLWDGRLLTVLGHKGGNSPAFDFDLYSADFPTGVQTDLGGLGSINTSMARARDGRLFVVGTLARNELVGELAVSLAPTGFVESRLWVVDGLGTPGATVSTRDLNRDGTGEIVAKGAALSQPTDVELFELPGNVLRVFVPAFHSDRIGVIDATAAAISGWSRQALDLGAPPAGYARHGPRALALKTANPAQPNDPGPRLYCLNTLSHTVSVIDPLTLEEVARFPLRHDPTPANIRLGREFLYSADISGTGFVACASCHVDGTTDSLGWNLGDPAGFATNPIDPALLDGITGLHVTSHFPDNKGVMVTQSLQGLVSYYVNPDAQQHFSVAPYHWRGDRSGLEAFNGAFVGLMGAANVGTPQDPKGLTEAQMAALVDMVNTITYPPNPEQLVDRTLDGVFGDPDLEDGTGAARGMKLFHTRPYPGDLAGGRSCAGCHSLPTGSTRRVNMFDPISEQPILSPPLRMLFSREARLETTPYGLRSIVTGEFGMSHFGRLPSINAFLVTGFQQHFTANILKLANIIHFVRSLDSGTAPAIGFAATVDALNKSSAGVLASLDLLEGQARQAGIGIAVRVRVGGKETGHWFDAVADRYVRVDDNTSLTRSQLLDLLQAPTDVLIAEGTPLGSERRAAADDGMPPPLTGPAPDHLTLEPMVANLPWRDLPRLTKNWVKGTGVEHFRWDGEIVSGVPAAEPRSLQTLRVFQQALITKAPQFGLTAMRHEAPRRFRVAGTGIRHGARLELRIAADPNTPPPYATLDPVETIVLPIFATDRTNAAGHPIWETAVEADPTFVYTLLLGGPHAPDVADALAGNVTEPPLASAFDPVRWNLVHVTVVNADGTSSAAAQWQPLTLQ